MVTMRATSKYCCTSHYYCRNQVFAANGTTALASYTISTVYEDTVTITAIRYSMRLMHTAAFADTTDAAAATAATTAAAAATTAAAATAATLPLNVPDMPSVYDHYGSGESHPSALAHATTSSCHSSSTLLPSTAGHSAMRSKPLCYLQLIHQASMIQR
jgi:hypothetical protein